jgi:cytochrome c-type protein NapB
VNRIWASMTMISALALAGAGAALAQSGGLTSIRGNVPIEQTAPAPEIKQQNTSGRFDRAYRQQPPLIPHSIESYEIDLKVNQCMRCHDWPYNVQEGAPKISETHYIDRNGVALDQVARTRWFCTQCHVPQDLTRTPLDNTFKSAVDVE